MSDQHQSNSASKTTTERVKPQTLKSSKRRFVHVINWNTFIPSVLVPAIVSILAVVYGGYWVFHKTHHQHQMIRAQYQSEIHQLQTQMQALTSTQQKLEAQQKALLSEQHALSIKQTKLTKTVSQALHAQSNAEVQQVEKNLIGVQQLNDFLPKLQFKLPVTVPSSKMSAQPKKDDSWRATLLQSWDKLKDLVVVQDDNTFSAAMLSQTNRQQIVLNLQSLLAAARTALITNPEVYPIVMRELAHAVNQCAMANSERAAFLTQLEAVRELTVVKS